jgi:hypothetical protein
LSTTPVIEVFATVPDTRAQPPQRAYELLLVSLLTATTLFVHGYHPYSEDGGLYVAGIKHLLNPALYRYSSGFVDAHLRYSLFAPAVAGVIQITHLGLATVLLALHLLTTGAALFAVWFLAARLYKERSARIGAVVMMGILLTVPVAGTSLILMDPYLTARSLALPCTLLAIAAVFDWQGAVTAPKRRHALALGVTSLLILAVTHPLMAAYGVGDVLILACLSGRDRRVRLWGTSGLCALAILLAAVLQAFAPTEPDGYLQVAVSRYYWFLLKWQWYEIFGLIAPLAILAGMASLNKAAPLPRRNLATMGLIVGLTATMVAVLFAHESGAVHLVARLQPLRAFQMIYILMIVVLGAAVGEHLLKRNALRWSLFILLPSIIMYSVQRSVYPSSPHIEWPHDTPPNQWQQAFRWIEGNTPRDAFFALDAKYTSAVGEDAQSFRAIAERSALPDFSKDGGEASITPGLTAAWIAGQQAQKDLSMQTDSERLARLRPLKVDWLVLQQGATTGFDCLYRNDVVMVCRLPSRVTF